MKRNDILSLIKESFLSKELSTLDVYDISTFCNDITFGYDPQGFNLLPESGIPASEGEKRIEAFDQMFRQYSKKFIIFPEMIDFMVTRKTPADIYFIQRNKKLDIVYKDINAGKMYHLDYMKNGLEAIDFRNRAQDFEDIRNGLKNILDTKMNPNRYGCPTKIQIPLKDLQDFDKEKHLYAELVMSITDSTNNDFTKRVSLVMRYYNNQKRADLEYYDTFDPCPPGNC